jgi:hypothetical protein
MKITRAPELGKKGKKDRVRRMDRKEERVGGEGKEEASLSFKTVTSRPPSKAEPTETDNTPSKLAADKDVDMGAEKGTKTDLDQVSLTGAEKGTDLDKVTTTHHHHHTTTTTITHPHCLSLSLTATTHHHAPSLTPSRSPTTHRHTNNHHHTSFTHRRQTFFATTKWFE